MSDCRKCAKFEECAVDEDCGLFKPKPQTNADRIRSMTDEELMRLLLGVRIGNRPWCDDEPCNERYCSDCITEWLKEEVRE